ncbi:hypothetical protein PR048_018246 [Dryococelus australis]|uniref:Integrase catalytic domain-containing protein n=1 Tax=Dryococelus australis TaxID=614101 RepID=A0ABQ9HBR2_9NEOP|nr:hypothetical protein PR048_018246 [Dryococelus australis]
MKCSGKKPLVLNRNKMVSCSSESVLLILSDNRYRGRQREKKEFLKKDAKAKSVIVQCLPDKYLDLVKDARRAKDMFKSVEEMFERKTVLSKLYLKKKLLALKFKPKERVEEHSLRSDGLVCNLENAGAKMDDTDKICCLLLTMGDNFSTVITAVEIMKQVLNLLFSEDKCPQCLEGNAKRLPFKKNEKSTQSIGELFHSDISVPVKTATKEDKRYFQVIVDNFSHFVTVYLLKTKSEAEENLMNFIKMVKTQHGVKSKRIRLYNGGEFSSNPFKKLCADKGIIIEYTTPYTLQQNSKAERMNLMLMNKVGTKFAETDLPRTLWGEAVRASAYELNRSPTSINIEEENEHVNGKDSTEVKTDTDENKTKEVNKHGTPQQSSEESDETIKKPSHLQEYELYIVYCLCAGEPQDYEDAIKLGNEWEEAIENKKYGLKKARLVAKGFQEDPANDVYAPVARLPTICLLTSIAVSRKWEIQQLDVHTAFRNGYLDDDIYIKTPDGVKNKPGVLKLKRSLYGLCSAPRKWNERFYNFMGTHGMKVSTSDFCLCIGKNVWLIIWVDVTLIIGEKTQV